LHGHSKSRRFYWLGLTSGVLQKNVLFVLHKHFCWVLACVYTSAPCPILFFWFCPNVCAMLCILTPKMSSDPVPISFVWFCPNVCAMLCIVTPKNVGFASQMPDYDIAVRDWQKYISVTTIDNLEGFNTSFFAFHQNVCSSFSVFFTLFPSASCRGIHSISSLFSLSLSLASCSGSAFPFFRSSQTSVLCSWFYLLTCLCTRDPFQIAFCSFCPSGGSLSFSLCLSCALLHVYERPDRVLFVPRKHPFSSCSVVRSDPQNVRSANPGEHRNHQSPCLPRRLREHRRSRQWYGGGGLATLQRGQV
jgi:hypothetical protein